MAGTLTISTLSDGTNSTSATNLTKAPCVAWVNFNGITTATIRASYNVSSVTRNGAGDYTINYTSALADANYCAVIGFTSRATSSGTNLAVGYYSTGSSADTYTSTQLRLLEKVGTNGASEDIGNICVACFR